ncbi:MAG: endonuclease/exonuclease/phosphatase family protein [Candidatus Tectomicrobia bacterium]
MIGIAISLALILLLLGALLWAGGGKTIHATQGSGIIESIPDALEQAPLPSHTLIVLSYNLGYGLGGHHDAGRRLGAADIYDRLDHIIETIAASEADVTLLQEVDFASQRTHDIDQLHYIAAALGWGFAARAMTWECRYLPYPVWPFGRPTGRLRAGMGVISRFPLVQNTRQRLSQSRARPLLTPLFASYHTVQMVDVQCGSQMIRLLNAHLNGGEASTRLQQAQELVAFVQQVATSHSVLMGSFNAAVQTPDPTMDVVMDGLRDRFHIMADEALTYPAMAPHSRLDHVFIADGLQALSTRVMLPDTPVTEHLPLIMHLRWPLPMLTQEGGSTHERL